MKIYLDFDGCIANTVKAIVDCYNEDFQYYKDFQRIYSWDINTWDFKECELASAEYIDTYFNQPRFFEKLEFMPEAKHCIKTLQDAGHEIEIISMCYSPNYIGKQLWLSKNLPNVKFSGVNYKEYKDKSHIDMSDAIFIDDSANNLITSNARFKFCFGEILSWNEDWDGKRVRTWKDVFSILNEQNNIIKII